MAKFSLTATLKSSVLTAVFMLMGLSLFLFIQHEVHMINKEKAKTDLKGPLRKGSDKFASLHTFRDSNMQLPRGSNDAKSLSNARPAHPPIAGSKVVEKNNKTHDSSIPQHNSVASVTALFSEHNPSTPVPYDVSKGKASEHTIQPSLAAEPAQLTTSSLSAIQQSANTTIEQRGILMCDGKQVDSEIIFWKRVAGDITYESPITPHHGIHHDRYLTFEYDQGGWNNVRMGMECLIVIAHAMGRTLVIPPQQHLYLLGKTHKDEGDAKAHDEMGFEDFFDIDLLRSHKGFHVIQMDEFMAKEGVTGGLHGLLPPGNTSDAWGPKLWTYLDKVADANPEWTGKFLVMPRAPGNFSLEDLSSYPPRTVARMKAFGGERSPVYYDEILQTAHHIHFPADGNHRLLQHYYAFSFFADPDMQSFYRRFVRDFMRYRDEIQCAGAELVRAVREDALATNPGDGGDFYALHLRRGDFQFKEVKISATKVVENLHLPGGESIIPEGAVVYLSTDDPDGVCLHCLYDRKPCETYPNPRPVGCPDDPSWDGFKKAGWKIRFLSDYLKKGVLKGVNPNLHGMVESIVCSRAKIFAGTYFSTFTGYIHRLRGYHGLGEASYYHTTGYLMHMQMRKSVGHGFSREWRAGWTDDAGGLI